jgi:hypothetical protein
MVLIMLSTQTAHVVSLRSTAGSMFWFVCLAAVLSFHSKRFFFFFFFFCFLTMFFFVLVSSSFLTMYSITCDDLSFKKVV